MTGSLDVDFYRRLLESSPVGVVLVDAQHPDRPVVYANASFQLMTGYSAEELIGRNLRMLQRDDRDQDGRERLRQALKQGQSCRVLMRNYRKDGALFWNEISISPLSDANGVISHYAGYHRDAGERLRLDPKVPRDSLSGAHQPTTVAIRDDRLTGLYTLSYLEELLKRDWAMAQREKRSIAIFAIDIDSLELYNTTFGRAAGDSMIRRVAYCISGSMRRASDVTARIEGGSIIAFAPGMSIEQARAHADTMAERVRVMRIHHPRSPVLRYVSVSIGVAALVPDVQDSAATLLQDAQQHLQMAKDAGRNRAA